MIQAIHGVVQKQNPIHQHLNVKAVADQEATTTQRIVHPALDHVQAITVTVPPHRDVCQVATHTVTTHTVSKRNFYDLCFFIYYLLIILLKHTCKIDMLWIEKERNF